MTMKIPKGESFADLSQELIEKLKFKDSDDDYLDVSYDLLSIEVVELSPKTKDEDGNEIAGSEKPNSGKPLTPIGTRVRLTKTASRHPRPTVPTHSAKYPNHQVKPPLGQAVIQPSV
jgi:hypothetical protein